jgi:hypothetical protein
MSNNPTSYSVASFYSLDGCAMKPFHDDIEVVKKKSVPFHIIPSREIQGHLCLQPKPDWIN